MTLTIGIIAKNGFVLSADSRMSSDFFLNDSVEKIFVLSDNIAVGIAGEGALGSHIFDIIKQQGLLTSLDLGIQAVADNLQEILAKVYTKYYPKISYEDRSELKILLAGYSLDKVPVPHLYVLSSSDNFAPRQSPSGHNSIGVNHISQYILNRIYDKDKMEVEGAAKLSVFCQQETRSQTKSVGGKIKLGTFSDTQKFKLLTDAEVTKLWKTCKKMQDSHRGKFYPEDIEGADF